VFLLNFKKFKLGFTCLVPPIVKVVNVVTRSSLLGF